MFKFVSTKNNIELFHRAILSDDLPRTKLILEEAMKDPRFDIDEINGEGLTALQFSCFAGHLDTVKVLVFFKADTKKRDRDGNTLLHAAALAGKSEVVKYLLRCGGAASIKPVVRNDEQLMPIDMTDEIAIIVILLRAMLDQNYLEEMQEYMLDHPKLKRTIFEELKRVKCQETEKNEILRELPYSSHTSPRRQKLNDRRSSGEMLGRSISTFSKLSNSMQYIDRIATEDRNNNYNQHYHHRQQHQQQQQHYDAAPTLKRHDSTGSTSSHGSRSSRSSKGSSSVGVMRNEANNNISRTEYDNTHRQTQKYLENRFPPQQHPQNKSSSYEHASIVNNRSYSDGYISDSYDDRIAMTNQHHQKGGGGGRLSRSSSISSHSSNHTGVFSDTSSNFDFPTQQEPPHHQQQQRTLSPSHEEQSIYQNFVQPHRANSLPTITESENIYENLPLRTSTSDQQSHYQRSNKAPKFVPPPLPPRQPINNAPQNHHHHHHQSKTREYETVDSRTSSTMYSSANGSETDSGIDINETTAGRVFALSLDEQPDSLYAEKSTSHSSETNNPNTFSNSKSFSSNSLATSYSKPIGIYYSEHMNQTTVRRSGEPLDDTALLNNTNNNPAAHMMVNPKYRSWNGRTLLETQQQQHENSLAPYSSHHTRRQRDRAGSRDEYDTYQSRQQQQQQYTAHAHTGYHHQHPGPAGRRHTTSAVELRQFNFEHQPEIML